METQDPQDTAVLSDDMAEPKPVQQEVRVRSVYEGLVEIAKTHGKLYRTNGKHADMMKFDLTAHSVFVGNVFIIHNGTLKQTVLETSTAKIDLTGLPWLTQEERRLDPVALFKDHYLSRPNGSERYMLSNFPAKDVDEMGDDEIAAGMPRSEARIRLEAWMLCAALDGTLRSYVTRQPNWLPGNWWWSPPDEESLSVDGQQLVIKTDWWARKTVPIPRLVMFDGKNRHIVYDSGTVLARIPEAVCDSDARAMQVSAYLARLAKSLAQDAMKLQMRAKCYDLDPMISEVNRIVEYIDTGRMRNA